MGKEEQILREIAARPAHATGSGYPVPDHTKSAAQYALNRISQLEGINELLEKTNLEIGPAYHDWRNHAERLIGMIRDAVLHYQAGRTAAGWNLLTGVIDEHDDEIRRREQATEEST